MKKKHGVVGTLNPGGFGGDPKEVGQTKWPVHQGVHLLDPKRSDFFVGPG